MFKIHEDTATTMPVMDKGKLLDACIAVGIECWIDFCLSENGSECLEKLPSEQVRDRAAEIFLLGFCCRMLVSPPIVSAPPDSLAEEKELNRLWIDHLETSGGEIVLEGYPYPRTGETTLLLAKGFFRLGFRSATALWQRFRELRNQKS